MIVADSACMSENGGCAGIKFLVDMRADVRQALKQSPATASPLRALDRNLRSHPSYHAHHYLLHDMQCEWMHSLQQLCTGWVHLISPADLSGGKLSAAASFYVSKQAYVSVTTWLGLTSTVGKTGVHFACKTSPSFAMLSDLCICYQQQVRAL